MRADQLTKLVRILKLTDSDNEGEAVAAMRAANRYLKSINESWESLYKQASHKLPFEIPVEVYTRQGQWVTWQQYQAQYRAQWAANQQQQAAEYVKQAQQSVIKR